MFTRIMAVVLAVIMALTITFSAMGIMTIRNQKINATLEQLKHEARDIAFMAAQKNALGSNSLFGSDSSAQRYLERKAASVYQDWGAYIQILDRQRRVMDNMELATYDDPDFALSLGTKELNEAFHKVLGGEEITVRTVQGGEAVFTVGVPYVRNDRVLGAVLIRTKAQSIEGGTRSMILAVLLVSVLALCVAGIVIFFFCRSAMRPLRELTDAARSMADGNFDIRVRNSSSDPEIEELSTAFNTMADKLSDTERGRREFVANVSHELRSPITAISGFVQGMEDGTIPESEHASYLKLVGDETKRLAKLIGDLLSLSRLEREDASLELSDFDICEMLRRAIIRRVNDLEAMEMEVECDFLLDPCFVRADSDRIEQVVVNLVDNAIKFTPSHGCITLKTEDSGDHVTVTVADNGADIPPEDRAHVFERFFTSDRAHTVGKGTGLGLSICQRIMEMHEQTIRLLDQEDGAAFAFTLAKGEQKDKPEAQQRT